jgi:hypothetical protein
MSVPFGFGVGDFLAVGQLALDIYHQIQGCSGSYRDLSHDAGQFVLTISGLENLVKQGRLDASQTTELLVHGQKCKDILLEIREVLDEYESLSTKSKKIRDVLGWDYEGATDLRARLTAAVVMLSAFYNGLMTSSLFRLENAMNRMLREIRDGQKSPDSISISPQTQSKVLHLLHKHGGRLYRT